MKSKKDNIYLEWFEKHEDKKGCQLSKKMDRWHEIMWMMKGGPGFLKEPNEERMGR